MSQSKQSKFNLTGKLPIPMTNDFIFKVLFQSPDNSDILKALICASYKEVHFEDIREITVLNPIEIGDTLDDKTTILDIKAVLDNRLILNLEMQVINKFDWPERSVTYLCRCFDNMTKGEHYRDKKAAYHIGFLDYTLFADSPEFCADYVISNRKTGQVYTSKFGLTVVDLTHIELATEEDKNSHLDLWASFFKAKTWEELDMLAQKDPYIEKTVTHVKKLTEDEKLRMIAEARQDQIMQMNDFNQHYQNEIAIRDAKLAEQASVLAEQASALAEKDSALAEKDSALAEKDSALAEKDSRIAELEAQLAGYKNM